MFNEICVQELLCQEHHLALIILVLQIETRIKIVMSFVFEIPAINLAISKLYFMHQKGKPE